MEDRRERWRRIWTVARLEQALSEVIKLLGSQVRGAWEEFAPLDLVERLDLQDRLEAAEVMQILESLRDLGILEIRRLGEIEPLTYWFRSGTMAAVAANQPERITAMLKTFLGEATEPCCRSG